ncbi:MAG: RHS repeat protein [Nitrospira sp.]|nr:RHS repeat protein [Nitrospira sp.]
MTCSRTCRQARKEGWESVRSTTDPLNRTTTLTYDAAGNVATSTMMPSVGSPVSSMT